MKEGNNWSQVCYCFYPLQTFKFTFVDGSKFLFGHWNLQGPVQQSLFNEPCPVNISIY